MSERHPSLTAAETLCPPGSAAHDLAVQRAADPAARDAEHSMGAAGAADGDDPVELQRWAESGHAEPSAHLDPGRDAVADEPEAP